MKDALMQLDNLRVDLDRLLGRIEQPGKIGALDGGGVCRLTLTNEDRKGRDLVVGWMNELGRKVTEPEDIRAGANVLLPVMPATAE